MLELVLLASLQQPSSRNPDSSYLFFVASEGFNQVALVRFGPGGARIEHRTLIRLPSVDSANPRALRVAPGGQYYYVTTANGFPTGELLKFRVAADSAVMGRPADTLREREPVDPHAAVLQISPDGQYAWITHAAPVGDQPRSWISIVYLKPMAEVARIATCAAARGGLLTADGTRHYSTCQQDDQLVEIDVTAMKISRRLALPASGAQRCAPGAVTTAPDGSRVYVACQSSNDVIEVDARSWSVTRRITVGTGPGDLAVTPDGRTLVVTNQGSQNVSLVDLASGHERARVGTVRAFPTNFSTRPDDFLAWATVAAQLARLVAVRVPANVVISPDDRYAFVSVAASGADAATVDVIDLDARAVVATVEVGRGARGIDFWKIEAKKVPN